MITIYSKHAQLVLDLSRIHNYKLIEAHGQGLKNTVQRPNDWAIATVKRLLAGNNSERITTLGNAALRKIALDAALDLSDQGDDAGAQVF